MMPYNEIEIFDIFSNPFHRGYGKLSGLEYVVIDKKDRMIKVQPISYSTMKPFGKPIWKSHKDRMFSETWKKL